MKTGRTQLRRPRASDVDALFEIENDPEVYRYLPPGRPFSLDQVTQRLQKSIDEQEGSEPFGSWVAECGQTHDFIAWCVLFKMRYDHYELGFVVRKKYWNQGYGFEIANAITDYGFSQGLEKIVAAAVDENKNSWRLLEKIGFEFKKTLSDDNGVSCLKFYEKLAP